MNNKNTQTKLPDKMPKQRFRGLKLILNEFNATIFQATLFGTVMAAFALISLFVQGSVTADPATRQTVEDVSFGLVARPLATAIMFSVINSIRNVVRDKSTLDRNRVMFLTNKKEVVVFSKVIVDLFNYMIPVIMTLVIAIPLIISKGGAFGSDFAIQMVAFMFITMFTYLIATFVMRWITSLELPKLKMWIILGAWTTVTLVWMIGAGIAFGILGGTEMGGARTAAAAAGNLDPSMSELINTGKMPVSGFIYDNQIWLSCVPIMNFITPFMALYGFMDTWTVAPVIGECLVAVIVLWRPVSGVLKTYLTT